MRESNETIAEQTLQMLRDLQDEQARWTQIGEFESESPFASWLDGVLSVDRVTKAPLFGGPGEPQLKHWELLLGWGGPSILLELEIDGSGAVLVAWWGPTYRLPFGRVLTDIADELATYDEAFN